jgi:hypothetical protein
LLKKKHISQLRPDEVVIFNVQGSYGNYQVKVGALNKEDGSRSIEINGRIHHLFVSNECVRPIPSHEDVKHNMRGTIIMNDISVELFDGSGQGMNVVIEPQRPHKLHPSRHINLAGDSGKKYLNDFESSQKMADETYQIVQEDILKGR